MAAPSIPLITEEEYLNSSYEPDREFVDGVLVERNVGTPDHGLMQLIVGEHLRRYRKQFGYQVITECRTRVLNSRYRIPDVMAVATPYRRDTRALSETPVLVIEILSPDDRVGPLLQRLRDFDSMGVPNVIVLDPERRTAFRYKNGSLMETKFEVLVLPGGEVPFPSDELFAKLDED